MKVSGVKELRRKLQVMPVEARRQVRAAIGKSAAEIAAVARGFAPVGSGALRDSIGWTFGQYRSNNANVRGVSVKAGAGDPDLTATIYAGNSLAWYAALVEFGTKPHRLGGRFAGAQHPGSQPKPFLNPAFRLMSKRAKRRITTAINKAARAAAKK